MERSGSLHLLRLGSDPATDRTRYAVSYAPYDRRGGALPTRAVDGEAELVAFLTKLNVDEATARAVAAEARDKGRASLPNVVLSDQELRRHGLQEMGILESVISYLSS